MDGPKRRTRPSVGFVLLIFALVAGLSLGATAALPVSHSASSPGATTASPASSHAAPTAKSVSNSKASPDAYPASSYLRIFNAVPGGGPFDVYLNGTLTYAGVPYTRATAYWPLFPGLWVVSVYPAGATPVAKNLTYTTSVTLITNVYQTLALVGQTTAITSVLLTDSNAAPTTNHFSVRFFHASPNQTAVTIKALDPLASATVNWTMPSTAFEAASAYQAEANQTVNVTAALTSSGTVIVYANNTNFTTNDYTIALVGNNTVAAPLALLFLLDGSYSKTPTAVHPVVPFVTQITPLSAYTTLPINLLYSLSVTNSSIITTGTTMWLNVTDFTTGKLCQSISLSPFVYNVSATEVLYPTVPTWGTVTSAYWGIELTSAMLINTTACPHAASDPSILSVAAEVTDPVNGTGFSTATQQTAFVYVAPTSSLHVGSTPAAPTTFSIYANYSAQYVGRVALSIYNPVNGLVAFSANLLWVNGTPTVVTWLQTVAGSYPYTLSVYTAAGVYNTTGTINVLPTGSTYYNTTTWTNATLISGLSSGAAGTLLLVVGLLIGMLVAMVVGRMVWGGPKTVPPAQPWAQKPAAANTCSVCGQSFATPEELAAHSKSEHGMQ